MSRSAPQSTGLEAVTPPPPQRLILLVFLSPPLHSLPPQIRCQLYIKLITQTSYGGGEWPPRPLESTSALPDNSFTALRHFTLMTTTVTDIQDCMCRWEKKGFTDSSSLSIETSVGKVINYDLCDCPPRYAHLENDTHLRETGRRTRSGPLLCHLWRVYSFYSSSPHVARVFGR